MSVSQKRLSFAILTVKQGHFSRYPKRFRHAYDFQLFVKLVRSKSILGSFSRSCKKINVLSNAKVELCIPVVAGYNNRDALKFVLLCS